MEELDLKSLLITMWEKRITIIAITAVFILIGAIYSYFFITPKYESYTQLLLAKNSEISSSTSSSADGITQADLTLNKNLVSTYSTLLKTKMVLNDVLNNLKQNKDINVPSSLTVDSLKSNLTVTAVPNTDIINITVRNTDPELAKAIAEELAQAFIKKVYETYHLNNVNIVENPEADYTPVNINHMKDVVIFALIGMIISSMFVCVMDMFNVRVRTVSDLEKITDVPVLVEIAMISNKKGEMN